MKKAMILSQKDNVATVLEDVTIGDRIEIKDWNKNTVAAVESLSEIHAGHKILIEDRKAHDPVIKYGHIIGQASKPISVGELVHIHNLESLRGRGDLI